jgi:hypothetical protein
MSLFRILALFLIFQAAGILFFRCGAPFPEEDPMDDRFPTGKTTGGLGSGKDPYAWTAEDPLNTVPSKTPGAINVSVGLGELKDA